MWCAVITCNVSLCHLGIVWCKGVSGTLRGEAPRRLVYRGTRQRLPFRNCRASRLPFNAFYAMCVIEHHARSEVLQATPGDYSSLYPHAQNVRRPQRP